MPPLLPVRCLALLAVVLSGCQAHSQTPPSPASHDKPAAPAPATAAWWHDAAKLAPLGVIPSVRRSAEAAAAERAAADTARAAAGAYLQDFAAWRRQPEPASARRRCDASLALRERALASAGYGNLVLAGAAEDAALLELARLLADPAVPWTEIKPRLAACLAGGPSAETWRQALAAERDPLPASPTTEARAAVPALSAVLEAVLDRPAPDGAPSLPGRLDYGALLENYDPVSAVWLTIHRAVRRAALESCAAVRSAGLTLPDEREAFRALLREKASDVLLRKDRLGGPIDSDQAWTAWRQMVDAPSPAAQP